MNADRTKLMQELRAADFRLSELLLFLDTHPGEAAAVEEYNKTANKAAMMRRYYEKLYGPLTIGNQDENTVPWKWIDGPWPWEGGNA